MTVDYIVRVRNRAGARQYDVTDFLSLNYSKFINDVGVLSVNLSGNHQAISALEKDGQIEIWRFDGSAGIAGYCDFFGLYRGRNRATPGENINGTFTLKAVSQLHYLKRSILAYPAGKNLFNDFTADPAETVMKNMVRYNATSVATIATNDRTRDAGSWSSNVTVQADAAGGSNITKAFAHRNLLEALQDVATLSGLDFDLVKTGARAWQFRTGAFGSDLTSTVKFSLSWGNLDNPSLEDNSLQEATVAIVGGEDSGASRDFAVRTGPNYVADYNDMEIFVNASNQLVTSLNDEGDARLNELRDTDSLRTGIKESGAFRYGRDFCIAGQMGDTVSVTYYEATQARRIVGAHVSVDTSSGSQKPEAIQLDTVIAL